MPVPEIAVLLPLQEARDIGARSLQAWDRQSMTRGRYELVLLAPGEDAALEREARRVLRAHDRWLELPGADEYALFNLGARATEARWVFLTEVHCVPNHRCLEAMLDHLQRSGEPGARGVSFGVGHGAMGELERVVYEDHLALGGDDDHWRKVLIHSLAVRTDAFLAAGGMPSRYGDFAPWALAIELREQGQFLGYARDSMVEHHYTGELVELMHHVRDFAHGEMRYWRDQPELSRAYLDEPEEWIARGTSSRTGARMLLGQMVRTHALRALRSRTAGCLCAAAVLGPRMGLTRTRLRLASLRIGMALEARRRQPSERRYRRLWEARARAARWEYLVRTPEPEWLPKQIGLYAPETLDGVEFHWTGPSATFDLDVSSGPRTCVVEVLPLRPHGATRFLLNGRPVEGRSNGSTVQIPLNTDGPQRLGLVSAPLRPWRQGAADRRELGMPIKDVRCT